FIEVKNKDAEDMIDDLLDTINGEPDLYIPIICATDMMTKDARGVVFYRTAPIDNPDKFDATRKWTTQFKRNNAQDSEDSNKNTYQNLYYWICKQLSKLDEYQSLYAQVTLTNAKGSDATGTVWLQV
ncbi:MAG: hypothetical protein JKY27_00395, partial [Magnetovibrio sp.]|nr:hypothetical protein [Magnetovibrio sp.]